MTEPQNQYVFTASTGSLTMVNEPGSLTTYAPTSGKIEDTVIVGANGRWYTWSAVALSIYPLEYIILPDMHDLFASTCLSSILPVPLPGINLHDWMRVAYYKWHRDRPFVRMY